MQPYGTLCIIYLSLTWLGLRPLLGRNLGQPKLVHLTTTTKRQLHTIVIMKFEKKTWAIFDFTHTYITCTYQIEVKE